MQHSILCRVFVFVCLVVSTFLTLTLFKTNRAAAQTAPAIAVDTSHGSLLAFDSAGQPAGQCPLKHTEVKAEVSGFLSRVTVTQEFENPFPDKIEAVYTFPLPQAAAVDDLLMIVGGRTIRGKIMRREEAKTAYTEARERGQVASLLDQQRPNVFTQAVANIVPGASIKVVISYVETLKYEGGSYEWSFPMVVGRRYTPAASVTEQTGGAGADAAGSVTPPVAPPGTRAGHDISIEVSLDAGVPLDNISSATHEITTVRPDDRRAVVRLLSQSTIPNKDFVLTYDVATRQIEDALLTHRARNGGFFTFILQPPERVTVEDVTPKELVFVLDTSGSMSGFPIEKAKETMNLAFDGLNPQDTFNLITFSGSTKILFPAPVPATAQNLQKARKFLESLAGDGGTEMMGAIRAALDPTDSQAHIRVTCFMTDGQVGNDQEILAEVRKHPRARVFAMGFGNAPNRFLLDKMTEYGRGEVEYVTGAGDSSAVARRFHERVRNPLLTDLEIDWSGLPVADVYPRQLPDLFSAKPVVLTGRYTGAARGRLILRGKMAGRDFFREVQVELPEEAPQHDVLATLWARRKIDDLMAPNIDGLQQTLSDEARETVTRLGLDYRLMTQFTSFVAIEDQVSTDGGEPRRVDVPAEETGADGIVGGITAAVNVSGTESAIDTTDSKIQTNVSTQVGELLPHGSNFTTLLKLAPAARPEPLSGGFQVDGASGAENSFVVDGQEVTNFRTGTLNTNNNVPLPVVEEVMVKSGSFEAEYGGATGGVINVVTKSGTNEYRGEFGLQLRPALLQANASPVLRYFRDGSGASLFQRAEYLVNPRPAGTSFFPTANLGGPVVHDRAWFFLSYTPQFLNRSQDLNYVTPDPRDRTFRLTENYRARQINQYAFSRLDVSVTDSLRLGGTFTWNPVAYRGLIPDAGQQASALPTADFGGDTGVLAGRDLLGRMGGRVNANNVTGSLSWTATPNMIISVRAGRGFLNEKARPEDGAFSDGVPRTQQFICASGDPRGGCETGFRNFPTNYVIDYDVSVRRTFEAEVDRIANGLGGRHQFKFGYQYNGVSNDVRAGYRDAGLAQLFYGVPLDELTGDPTLSPSPGAIGSGLFQRFGIEGRASGSNQTFFVQDSYQPFTRLTLNLGARAEIETVPSYSPANPGIRFNLGDKLAPRLGASFDVTGDGRTKLYGFYGWFYDRFKYELPRSLFGGEFFRVDYFELFDHSPLYNGYTGAAILGDRPDLPGGNCPRGGITGGVGLSRCQLDFRVPANETALPFATGGGVDPDLRPFRQSELSFGVERELGDGFLFSARYTHKRVGRAVEAIGFFNAEGSTAYLIGNPGFGAAVALARQLDLPATPKARRDYDALELRFQKRHTRNYYFEASYTLSRLFGNYPGLASADEAVLDGPRGNHLFALPFAAFTADGRPNDGRLPTDRPHVFKFYGAYILDWERAFGFGRDHSTEVAGFTTAQSGTPLTTRFMLEGVASAILNGRGDLGRTAALTQTDFSLRHKYRFGEAERFTLVFDVDVLNAFNERNVLSHSQLVNARVDYSVLLPGDSAAERVQNFFRLGTLRSLVNADLRAPARLDDTYNRPNAFQAGRSVRFGLRLLF